MQTHNSSHTIHRTPLISHPSSQTTNSHPSSHTTNSHPSSHTTNSHNSSPTTHLTPLISHHSSHTPHLTPLIHTTHLTPLISYQLISYQTHIKLDDTKLHMWGYPVLLFPLCLTQIGSTGPWVDPHRTGDSPPRPLRRSPGDASSPCRRDPPPAGAAHAGSSCGWAQQSGSGRSRVGFLLQTKVGFCLFLIMIINLFNCYDDVFFVHKLCLLCVF